MREDLFSGEGGCGLGLNLGHNPQENHLIHRIGGVSQLHNPEQKILATLEATYLYCPIFVCPFGF